MKTIAFLVVGLFLSSCGERTALEFSANENFAIESQLDFASVKRSIFSPKCVSCHKQYDSYEGVKADLSKIVTAVESDRMPKNAEPLTDVQKSFLERWVLIGAPRGNSSELEDDGILKPNWKSLSTKLLGPKCIQCHNPQGEAKFLDLSSREEIWKERAKLFNFEDPDSSYFLEVLKDPDEPMPPVWSGLPRLSDEEINVLKKWIGDGLP